MTSWDVITPTSAGTGVAKTSIGTQNKPTQAAELIEFVPYYAESGAYTAAESVLLECAIESVSVNDILPKRVITPPIQAGLGATHAKLIPILEAYECHTPLTIGSNQTLEAFVQAQVANTVAPVMGVGLHYSATGSGKKQTYYLKPDNETSTGTAATTVAGNTITVNGGKMLTDLYAAVTAGTVTASEDFIGSMEFSSNDFDNSMPLEVPVQPCASCLSTLVGVMQPKMTSYHNINMGMKSSCVINTTYRQSEAQTAAGNFIAGIGYTKA